MRQILRLTGTSCCAAAFDGHLIVYALNGAQYHCRDRGRAIVRMTMLCPHVDLDTVERFVDAVYLEDLAIRLEAVS